MWYNISMEKEIYYSPTGKQADIDIWAIKQGTLREIEESAQKLLSELREANTKAKVWIENKLVRKQKNDNGTS